VSVGLPSLSATTHVPASFFSFSRPALVGAGGNFGVADLSSARLIGAMLKSNPHKTNPRNMFESPHRWGVDAFPANADRTLTRLSNKEANIRQYSEEFSLGSRPVAPRPELRVAERRGYYQPRLDKV
jgi:hypothetical protein